MRRFLAVVASSFLLLSCQRPPTLPGLLKDIDAAPTMSAKDRVARDGLIVGISQADVTYVASKGSLSDSEAILLVVAFTRGRDDLKGRVLDIGRRPDPIGSYATHMLGSRASTTTAAI